MEGAAVGDGGGRDWSGPPAGPARRMATAPEGETRRARASISEGAWPCQRLHFRRPASRLRENLLFEPGSQFLATVAHGLRRRPVPQLTHGLFVLQFLVKLGS